MPQMGGLEFLRRLRAEPGLDALPVGVITGDYFLGECNPSGARKLGAVVRYKPIRMEDLSALTAQLLGRGAAPRRQAGMSTGRLVHVLGVPLDLGGGRRGVDMGPSAIRIAGLGERLAAMGCAVVDKGNLDAPIPKPGLSATRARNTSAKSPASARSCISRSTSRSRRAPPRSCSGAIIHWRPDRSGATV